MRLSRIEIENFRNFEHLDVMLDESVVIMGENQIGKSNLLFALRLVLDPSLPESARQLTISDFWDGLPRPLSNNAVIRVSTELTGFEDDEDILALLADHLILGEPMVARLTYEFRPRVGLASAPEKDSDFEYVFYGGKSGRSVNYEVRRRLPLEVLPALRDVEGDLARWSKSPLRPLLARAQSLINQPDLKRILEDIEQAADGLTQLDVIQEVATDINSRLKTMAGEHQAMDTSFGLAVSNPQKLLRSLRLRFDDGQREISEASLGAANVLYLALRGIELGKLAEEGTRNHTVFAVEEPEAHLHPHLQRKVYRSFLRSRQDDGGDSESASSLHGLTYLLTTHSPHIASIAPIKSFVVLRPSENGASTIGVSSAQLSLPADEICDLERYLDVTRAEVLFGRGVILVEGDAERFLLPVMAGRLGYDLDAIGITICSVSGTNFAPYASFLGPKGLNYPLAVLTDLDPTNKGSLGESRVLNSIVPAITDEKITTLTNAEKHGVFVNTHTLEVDLIRAGFWCSFLKAAEELPMSANAKQRFKSIREAQNLDDVEQFLSDISSVSKGRFAQRLAAHLATSKRAAYPEYIKKALAHVVKRIR